jgi:hypothetical protein
VCYVSLPRVANGLIPLEQTKHEYCQSLPRAEDGVIEWLKHEYGLPLSRVEDRLILSK